MKTAHKKKRSVRILAQVLVGTGICGFGMGGPVAAAPVADPLCGPAHAAIVNQQVLYEKDFAAWRKTNTASYLRLWQEQGWEKESPNPESLLDAFIDHHLLFTTAKQKLSLEKRPTKSDVTGVLNNYSIFSKEDVELRSQCDELGLADIISEHLLINAFLTELFSSLPSPTEAEIEKEYREHSSAYAGETVVEFRHLMLDKFSPEGRAAARIEALYRQILKDKAAFPLIAAKNSEAPSARSGAIFGPMAVRVLLPELVAVLEKMQVGDISAPLQSAHGWHIVELISWQPAELPPLEKLQPTIALSLGLQAEKDLVEKLQQELRTKSTIERCRK